MGRRIERLEVARPLTLRSHNPREAERILNGRTFIAVTRRGKALLFALSGGWTMTFHFSLWGTILVRPDALNDARTAVVVHLSDGNVIEFRDLQLSNLNLYSTVELGAVDYLASLGADPLDRTVTAARFRDLVNGRGALRNLLTDQSRLAGIGNLWAQEILFAAGLRPGRTAQSLHSDDWARLYRAMRAVLRRGIRAGGEPEFIDANGRKGRYRLAVYGRGGQPCLVCKTKIATGRVGGRPSFYCRKDQR